MQCFNTVNIHILKLVEIYVPVPDILICELIFSSKSRDGDYVKINESLIYSAVGTGLGTTYEFIDENVKNRTTYFYKLEDVDLYGVKIMHGPVSATPRLIYGIGK